MILSISDATGLATDIFLDNGVNENNARSVARALVMAEAAGQGGHGFRRIPAYIGQLRAGKVDGEAAPLATRPKPGVLCIDAAHGYSYPAIDLAVSLLPDIARQQGIALATIARSHHAGVLGLAVEQFADQGLMALMFANSPASMAPWGGNRPLFGTNPVAFAVPVAGSDPVVVDMALSKVARGRIISAQQKKSSIPDDWAFDKNGLPTTDPTEALAGTMMPAGEAKGAALALMVEVLSAALTGGNFAFQASSLLDDTGPPPSLGHTIIAIDPGASAGAGFGERMAMLAAEMASQDGVRLPGRRGQTLRRAALERGIEVEDDVIERARTFLTRPQTNFR